MKELVKLKKKCLKTLFNNIKIYKLELILILKFYSITCRFKTLKVIKIES